MLHFSRLLLIKLVIMLGIVAKQVLVIVPGISSGPEDFLGFRYFNILDRSFSESGVNLNVGMLLYFTLRSSKYLFCLFLSILILLLRLDPILVKNLLNSSAISYLSLVISPCSFISSEHSAFALFFLLVNSFTFFHIFLLFLKFSLK